jgi:hypothetical protein
MVRFVNAAILFGVFAVLTGGCKATIRVYDSQACSTDPNEDPQLVCSPGYNLVCANTYAIPIPDPREAVKWPGGRRPIYVCRMACNIQDPMTNASSDCNMVGADGQVDICCPNPIIYGKKYEGFEGVCTQRGRCDILRPMTQPDAGPPPVDGPSVPNGPPPSGNSQTPADAAPPPVDLAPGPADTGPVTPAGPDGGGSA